jgi:hypothetical protein
LKSQPMSINAESFRKLLSVAHRALAVERLTIQR